MANVLNRTTKEYLISVNTPDYPEVTWIINPDLSGVEGVPSKYWKITGDTISEMNQSEKNAVDAVLLPGIKESKKNQLRNDSDNFVINQGYTTDIKSSLLSMYSDGNKIRPNQGNYIQNWVNWTRSVENHLKTKQQQVDDATSEDMANNIAIDTSSLASVDPQITVIGALDQTDTTHLSSFIDVNAEVTDAYTGIKGPFYLMQELEHRKDLYNDSTNPIYEPGYIPILGSGGILQDHANRIVNIENIHGKLGYHNQELIKASYLKPKDVLFYYGYPNSFNSAVNGWSNEKVARDMAKYHLIVLGNGVQDPSHGDYANTQVIIPRIENLNPGTLIFGYVSTNQDNSSFQTKVDQWDTLQVHGIFMDEAGYDFGIDRTTFNNRINYVHSKTYSNKCFVNSWNTDHILGTANDVSYPNSTYNPTLVASNLNIYDWILLESFPVNTTVYTMGYEDKLNWAARGVKAQGLRATYGVNFASVGVISNDHTCAQALSNFQFISSLMWSLEGSGTSDTNYGANGAVTFWSRPDVKDIGHTWNLNASIQVATDNTNVYYRFTEYGKLFLNFNSGCQLSGIVHDSYTPVVLSSVFGINAKTSGTTNIYVVPSGKKAIINEAIIQVTDASSISTPPTLGIGVNAEADDIFSSATLTGLNSTSKIYKFFNSGTSSLGQSEEIIKCGVDTTATAVSMVIAIHLLGYLL